MTASSAGALRRLGLVHRHFRDEVVVVGEPEAAQLSDAPVGLGGLADGDEVARARLSGSTARSSRAGSPSRRADRRVGQEGFQRLGLGALADEVGDVEREEIAVRGEAPPLSRGRRGRRRRDRGRPSRFRVSRDRRRRAGRRARADELVLPVAFVPDDGGRLPRSRAFLKAAICARPWRPNRSPVPIERFSMIFIRPILALSPSLASRRLAGTANATVGRDRGRGGRHGMGGNPVIECWGGA